MNNETQTFGSLALSAGGQKLPLRICMSAAGFYIGTLTEDEGFPFTRESEEYFRTKEKAQAAMDNGSWTQRAQL